MISIPGTTMDLTPDDKPAIGLFGLETVGKTRCSATAPDPIGLIALDKKSKRTFQEIANKLGKKVVVNSKPLMTDKEAVRMAVISGDTPAGLAEIKKTYT